MISQRLGIFLLLSASSILLAACQPAGVVKETGHQNLDDFIVDLKAGAGATRIEVTSPAQGCTGGAATEMGCVQFAKNKQGANWLILNRDQKKGSCQSQKPADWVITKVELSATFDASTGKGAFGGSQPDWLVEAFPGVDQATGTLYFESDLSKASQKALIINLNNHEDGQLKTAYYQVTASSCTEGPLPIDIDPSIQNTGK